MPLINTLYYKLRIGLDLAFGAVDSNVELARTYLLSPISPPPPLLLLLLLLVSPSEIQEFPLSYSSFPLLVAVL